MSWRSTWGVVLAACVVVAGFLVLGHQLFRATERAAVVEFSQSQEVLAQEAARGIGLYFAVVAAEMRGLAQTPEVASLDEAATRREIGRVLDRIRALGVADVVVLDEHGVVLYSAGRPAVEGEDLSNQPYYLEASSLGPADSYVVRLVQSQGVESRPREIAVAVPMGNPTAGGTDSSSPLQRQGGAVSCMIQLESITGRFVSPIQSTGPSHVLLIDEDFTVLFPPDGALLGRDSQVELTRFPEFQGALARMAAGETGTAEFSYYPLQALDGGSAADASGSDGVEEQLIAFAPAQLGTSVWSVGVSAPTEAARKQVQSLYNRQLLVVGLSIVTALLGSSYTVALSRRANRTLGQRVETKTAELAESNKRLENALAELQAVHAFQQSVIDGVAEPLLVIGGDYQIRLMNLAARTAAFDGTALPEPCLCHAASHRRDTPCRGAEHPCPLEQVRASGKATTVVHEHHTASGELRVIEVLASPLFGDGGAFEGIIESMRDITDRVRAEKALESAYAFQQSLVEEERQRIARELHDGLAQLLGYVNTKAMAVRLLLKKGELETAEQHLLQLEEAARALFVDVREAILDLKISGQEGGGLAVTLEAYVGQFGRLSGLPVDLEIAPTVADLHLTAEADLQMLRIAQEALANVRKHAAATRAWVRLRNEGQVLELSIGDDGQGFNPDVIAPAEWPHIGLSTMRERAQAMGAEFALDTAPGRGTRITVRLALDGAPAR